MSDIISNDLAWLKHHIILLAIVIILVIGSVYGIESIIARHDEANNAKWQSINQTAIAQVQSLTDKLATDEADRAKENAQQTAILAQLAATISQRDRAVATVIQKDATLSAVEAAQKITLQTKAQPGEVIAQGDSVQMDLSVSRTVVANQDQLPVIQADLADTQKQLTAETAIAIGWSGTADEQEKIISAMKVQSLDADKACKAEVASVKASARKSKLKWFFIGLVTGVVGGHYIP